RATKPRSVLRVCVHALLNRNVALHEAASGECRPARDGVIRGTPLRAREAKGIRRVLFERRAAERGYPPPALARPEREAGRAVRVLHLGSVAARRAQELRYLPLATSTTYPSQRPPCPP